jgi:hypothetical protein
MCVGGGGEGKFDMGSTCTKHGENKTCLQTVTGKFEEKIPLRRTVQKFENNIKIDI